MTKLCLIFVLSFLVLTPAFSQGKIWEADHDAHRHERGVAGFDPFGNPVTTFTDARDPNPLPDEFIDMPTLEELMLRDQALRNEVQKADAPIVVPHYLAVDEEYRAAHPTDWMLRVITIQQSAAKAFRDEYRIDLVLAGIFTWQSDGTDNSGILADLTSDFASVSSGIVSGFTADADFTAGGKAYVYSTDPGTGYNVNYDQTVSATIYAIRHEISHNYSLGHDGSNSGKVCMMNYTYAYSVDYWDTAHYNELNSHRAWFQP